MKFLMGPGWAKKYEIFDGSGGWAKKYEIFDGSGVGKKSEIIDGSGVAWRRDMAWRSIIPKG
jgi:hypothetical protein